MPDTPNIAAGLELLTKREREALRLVSEHRLSKEIGPLMGVSKSRADALVESACRKLGVNGRRAAARVLSEHERVAAGVASTVGFAAGDYGIRSHPDPIGLAAVPPSPPPSASQSTEAFDTSERVSRQRHPDVGRPDQPAGAPTGPAGLEGPSDPPGVTAFEQSWPPLPPEPAVPTFGWSQLQRQLTDLAPAGTAAAGGRPGLGDPQGIGGQAGRDGAEGDPDHHRHGAGRWLPREIRGGSDHALTPAFRLLAVLAIALGFAMLIGGLLSARQVVELFQNLRHG
jgi:DNA-binding CsgD family transcriptional regulator